MKNKEKEEKVIKDFKAVAFMREVRDKISEDIKDMNFEQIIKYFEKRKLEMKQKDIAYLP